MVGEGREIAMIETTSACGASQTGHEVEFALCLSQARSPAICNQSTQVAWLLLDPTWIHPIGKPVNQQRSGRAREPGLAFLPGQFRHNFRARLLTRSNKFQF